MTRNHKRWTVGLAALAVTAVFAIGAPAMAHDDYGHGHGGGNWGGANYSGWNNAGRSGWGSGAPTWGGQHFGGYTSRSYGRSFNHAHGGHGHGRPVVPDCRRPVYGGGYGGGYGGSSFNFGISGPRGGFGISVVQPRGYGW